MNAYLRTASEGYLIAKNNCENKNTLRFIDEAVSWSVEVDEESEIGFTLPNGSIEAYIGSYFLSSFDSLPSLRGLNFPSLLNATCAAYTLYLQGYSSTIDIIKADTKEQREIKDAVSPFVEHQIEVSDRLIELSSEWVTNNLPF